MKYQINIEGMHCKGCASLIKMSLEDEGLQEVNVDLPTKTGTFTYETDEQQTKTIIDKAFAGLPGYSYHDLVTVN